MRKAIATVLLFIGLGIAVYNTRAFLPMVGSYPQRLQWLAGWSSQGYYAYNCSGFIAAAHGEKWVSERTMWQGDDGGFIRIAEFSGKDGIDESMLLPGDVVVFQGPKPGLGLHVVAYLGHGVWIDSDSRRGYISKYSMAQKSATDPWFSGKVRAYRWKRPPQAVFNPYFFVEEQEAMDQGE